MSQGVVIYTDGSCKGNPGPGGWAAVLIYGEHEKQVVGSESMTTNNRMEMLAAIEGLRALKQPTEVVLYTDSNYVKQGITQWIHNWKRNNWRTASKQAVKNADLWQQLDELSDKHAVTWKWVKGHSGNHYNELVDTLAQKAAESV